MNDATRIKLVLSLARDEFDGETGARHALEKASLDDEERQVYRNELCRLRVQDALVSAPGTEWAQYRGREVPVEEAAPYDPEELAHFMPPLRAPWQPVTPPWDPPVWLQWLFGLFVLWLLPAGVAAGVCVVGGG